MPPPAPEPSAPSPTTPTGEAARSAEPASEPEHPAVAGPELAGPEVDGPEVDGPHPGPPGPEPILADPNPGLWRGLLYRFYDLCWLLALAVGSPWWVTRSIQSAEFRGMVAQRLFGRGLPRPPGPGERRRILIHGVSVGEVKVAMPLVRALEQRHPEIEVVICATTDTGLEVARRTYPGMRIVRFPVDVSFIVSRMLRRIRPDCVVLVELEVWPNFLRCCNSSGIPVAVVNGRITGGSFGHYRLFRNLLPQFSRISLFCVQDDAYAARFRELSNARQRVFVTGNMKADGLKIGQRDPGSKLGVELRQLFGGRPGQNVIVAGSTHEPEEAIVTRAWLAGAPDSRLVLVPRHPERAVDVVRSLQACGRSAQRLTELRARGAAADPELPLVVDTIGELESFYALADLVYVGGSLVPHGGQNMLEPAAQGIAVVYGPHVDNFAQEAALLEDAGASLRVADEEALGAAIARLFGDAQARRTMAQAGLAVVQAQKGATEKTLAALEACCLGPREEPPPPPG